MTTTNSKYSGRKLKKPELKREGNYTMIPNAFILNPDIKDAELRLLQFIMTNKDDIVITTRNCIRYLGKTKPYIDKSFGRLIESGVLKITDDIIEVIITEEMKRYKIGYLHGKENLTTEVKKTLLSGKENLTTEVKKTYKKPLESIDNDSDTSPIILNNTRVLPVPAKGRSTEQSHSNDNTKGNTGIELDLERDALQSQASPSVLAPSLHTPKGEVEKVGEKSSLPFDDETLPIDVDSPQPTDEPEPIPTEPDERFAEQLKIYNTSKYFLPKNLDKVKNLYKNYAEQYPNKYMRIIDFEKVLVCLMTLNIGMVKMKGINFCLLYRNDICHHFKDIPQLRQDMIENPDETIELLRISELNE